MAHLDDRALAAFARRHIRHEVRMLARPPGVLTRVPEQTASEDDREITQNAVYEDLLVHARLLDEFLNNGGRPITVKACMYIPGWKESEVPPWRADANKRVAHLDADRTAPGVDGPLNTSPEIIRAGLANRLVAFHDVLPQERSDWFYFIPVELRRFAAEGLSG